MENETLIFYGDAVKATELEDGNVKLGGYLVRFSNEGDLDLTGDFFDRNTDFGGAQKSTAWFNHRMSVRFEGKAVKYTEPLPDAELTRDDVGIFAAIILGARNEYEKMLAKLGLAGKLSWSSGTAEHLVDREPRKNGANWIKRWPLGLDASLTPTPAEPRNSALPIKSLFDTPSNPQAEVSDTGNDGDQVVTTPTPNQETPNMDENAIKALIDSAVSQAVTDTVKAFQAEVKAGVQVVADEADRALKGKPFSAGEFFMAVKNAALDPGSIDKRLLPLKATGLNETIPSQGGYLVQQDFSNVIQEKMWGVGSLLARFAPIPVSGNGIVLNAVDETSRATGSRMGGVQGYWLEEGGTITSSKPKFRQISLRLKKAAALCYATDELLQDATAMEGWLTNNVPAELRFMVEDSIVNGVGVGTPLGIVASPALVQAVRTDATEVDQDDLARMWVSRYLGVNDYVWLINPEVTAQLEKITLGDVPMYMPPGGLSASPYGSLKGRPVIETEYSAALGTLGDILLISPSQYALITKGGVQSASSIHVAFTTAEQAFRFIYRVDGSPYWNSPVTPYKGSYSISPFIGLAAST